MAISKGTSGGAAGNISSTTVTVDSGGARLFIAGIAQNRNPPNLSGAHLTGTDGVDWELGGAEAHATSGVFDANMNLTAAFDAWRGLRGAEIE